MDKLDKCYYWHIITFAKLKIRLKMLRRWIEDEYWKAFKRSSRNKKIRR